MNGFAVQKLYLSSGVIKKTEPKAQAAKIPPNHQKWSNFLPLKTIIGKRRLWLILFNLFTLALKGRQTASFNFLLAVNHWDVSWQCRHLTHLILLLEALG